MKGQVPGKKDLANKTINKMLTYYNQMKKQVK